MVALSGNTTAQMMNKQNIAHLRSVSYSKQEYVQKINAQQQYVNKEELQNDGVLFSYASTMSEMLRAGEYQRNLRGVSVQMQQMDLVLQDIIQDVSDAKGFLASANTPLGVSMSVDLRMREHLSNLVSSLNAKFNEKALFAGYDTDQLPVDISVVNQTNLVHDSKNNVDIATSNYFVGDNSRKKIMIDENIEVEYAITASDKIFANLIGAYHQILSDPQNTDNLTKGFDTLDQAFKQLTEKRANFGAKMKAVEDAMDSWMQKEEDLQAVFHDLYGNNQAVIAGYINAMNRLVDNEKQTVDIIGLLLRAQNNILDKL